MQREQPEESTEFFCGLRRTESWNGAAESEILQSKHNFRSGDRGGVWSLETPRQRGTARGAHCVFYSVRRTESWHDAAESEIHQSRQNRRFCRAGA